MGACSTIGPAFRILSRNQNPKGPGLQTTTMVLSMMPPLMFVILDLGRLSFLHLVQRLLCALLARGGGVQKIGQSYSTARLVTGKFDSLQSFIASECLLLNVLDLGILALPAKPVILDCFCFAALFQTSTWTSLALEVSLPRAG